MKLLKLPHDVYQYYCVHVKGNEYTQPEEVRKKITRNIKLVKRLAPKEYIERKLLYTIYKYGNLEIKVRFGKVIGIENVKGWAYHSWMNTHRFKIEYEAITISLGIEDSKFKNERKRGF